jgi:hypothetical protein
LTTYIQVSHFRISELAPANSLDQTEDQFIGHFLKTGFDVSV